jgi:hypothetical protein
VLELFGVDEDVEVLEFGGVEDEGDLGEVGDVEDDDEDDGELDVAEFLLLRSEEVLSEVDDELLLFGLDCAPGAIDIRGPRGELPVDDGLEELEELDDERPPVEGAEDVAEWPPAEGAEDVADCPLVEGAEGVAELLDGVELEVGAELEDDCPPAAEDEEDAPPALDPPLPPLPPEPPPDCAFAAAALAMAKATASEIIPVLCMSSLRFLGQYPAAIPIPIARCHVGIERPADNTLRSWLTPSPWRLTYVNAAWTNKPQTGRRSRQKPMSASASPISARASAS